MIYDYNFNSMTPQLSLPMEENDRRWVVLTTSLTETYQTNYSWGWTRDSSSVALWGKISEDRKTFFWYASSTNSARDAYCQYNFTKHEYSYIAMG